MHSQPPRQLGTHCVLKRFTVYGLQFRGTWHSPHFNPTRLDRVTIKLSKVTIRQLDAEKLAYCGAIRLIWSILIIGCKI